jgi:hypothetical protein
MSTNDYSIDPALRIRELFGEEISSEQVFSYSFSHGYERLEFDNGQRGGMTYGGSYHPVDGFCHAVEDQVDATPGICVHCGRTLM